MTLIYYTKDIDGFYNCHEFFRFFQSGFGGQPGLIDRTGILNHLSNKNISTLYPFIYVPSNKNIYDIINERAIEILSCGKPVDVFWSGGLDSSVALISLISNTTQKYKRIRVVCNSLSIRENPVFFKRLKNHYSFLVVPRPFILNWYARQYTGNIIVTGEMGDQIMGSHFCFKYPEMASKPFKDVILKYKQIYSKFDDSPIKEFDIDSVIDICESLRCPYEIRSLYDLLTWINICFTWDFNCNRYINSNIPISNIYNFFSTTDFQNWGITNHYEKRRSTAYKKEYKIFLNNYFKDNYAFSMEKRTSPSTSSALDNSKNKIIAIDSGMRIYHNTIIDRLRLKKFLLEKAV